jgi:hypothetical protein
MLFIAIHKPQLTKVRIGEMVGLIAEQDMQKANLAELQWQIKIKPFIRFNSLASKQRCELNQ